jgi:hypothetical protein
MKHKKPIKRKTSAQAMVEFAIALPVLLLLLYGLLETGRYLFLYSTVVNASRQAVRYGSATGAGGDFTSVGGPNNTGIARYQDCYGIRRAAQTGAYIARFENILIDYDSGPNTPTANASLNPDFCDSVNTDGRLTSTILADNKHRITVQITEPYVPLVPGLVPFVGRNIIATSSRTILLSVSIEVTSPSVLYTSVPTDTLIPTETPSHTATPTFTETPTPTFTPITYTPTSSFTPTITLTPTVTFTPSNTPTPSYTPTPSFTPTPSKTPIGNCNLVTHGGEDISGTTFSMTINNPTGVDLQILDVTVFWNHDGGHKQGTDNSLRLRSATITSGSTTNTFWSGNIYSTNYTIIPGDPLLIPTGTSTITFTFHQSYTRTNGSERIFINFETNGCQGYPVDSNK